MKYENQSLDSGVKKFREISYSIQDKLEDFKTNDLKKEDITYYSAFKSIYYFNNSATDEEIIKIAGASYDAWLKDEEGYSISKISDFLAEKYFNKELTLEDIANASSREILGDATDGNIYYMKKTEEEIER